MDEATGVGDESLAGPLSIRFRDESTSLEITGLGECVDDIVGGTGMRNAIQIVRYPTKNQSILKL